MPKRPTYLRVKQKETGSELSVTQAMYDFAPDGYDLLEKKSATDAGGNPLPPKHKTTVAKAAAASRKTGNSATSEAGPVADTDKEK